ncbi:UspA domain-containing protein [Halosimplex carlsbadense 2-9-1]|uniref:UspA domain-containing protein n=1 Tax=Halosimplex carlsbadense 2-9-1 TaxID=797114 RepID=M0CZH5_9EURY|nr:universal stress protein [Halosimplex carlsbadense]ELZ27842.1 UspA domain-containing protein [Halosimplex carlsbadense 2-9-1]
MRFAVAIDGSSESDRALDHAVEMATAAGAELAAVHSVDPDVYDTGGAEPPTDRAEYDDRLVVESVDDAERRGERLLDDAVERAADAGLDIDGEVLYGDPVRTIPDFATREGYDGVFVGHRGLSEAQERVLGSVAKGIVERSSLPVTVVR